MSIKDDKDRELLRFVIAIVFVIAALALGVKLDIPTILLAVATLSYPKSATTDYIKKISTKDN